MEIKLLQLQTEKNVLNKIYGEDYIEYLTFLNGSILPNSDISTPVIRIQHTEFPKCNYCKIEELQRFYFIESITALNDGVYELRLKVDVLESFKSDILRTDAYVSRNQYEYSDKIVDNEVINISGVNTFKIELDNDLFQTEMSANEDALDKYILTIMTTEVSE